MPVTVADHRRGGQLVLGVAHAELGGDGERLDPIGDCRRPRSARRVGVERRERAAVRVVTTGEDDGRVVAQRLAEAGSLEHVAVEPDDDCAHRATLALDQGIRGQRGGQRDELDAIAAALLPRREHGVDGAADADGQIVVRGG